MFNAFLAPVNIASQASPGTYIAQFPKTIAAIVVPTCRSQPLSAIIPVIQAAAIKPIRYPPVGPKSTAGPALPSANTGNPAAPAAAYAITVQLPRRDPNSAPAINTAKVWPLTGTGLNGSGIANCALNAITTEPPKIKAKS